MSTSSVSFLTPPHREISNSRGVAIIDTIRMRQTWSVLHPAARDQPGGRRNNKLDAKSALMISKCHRNNAITNEAQLIRLGASGRKDFDTGSTALCTSVESDT